MAPLHDVLDACVGLAAPSAPKNTSPRAPLSYERTPSEPPTNEKPALSTSTTLVLKAVIVEALATVRRGGVRNLHGAGSVGGSGGTRGIKSNSTHRLSSMQAISGAAGDAEESQRRRGDEALTIPGAFGADGQALAALAVGFNRDRHSQESCTLISEP
jgi:hypothetical protein